MKRILLALALLLAPAVLMAQNNASTDRFVTSYSGKTATATGDDFQFDGGIVVASYSWQPNFLTAAPGAQTTNLEGSIDHVHWYTLDSSTSLAYTSDTVNGELRHVVNKPVRYLRCSLASVTIGSSTGLSCGFTAKKP